MAPSATAPPPATDSAATRPARDPSKPRRLPRSLSPSSISTYEGCPQRFEYSRIDYFPDPPGRAMLIGTFAHAVLEDLMKLEPALRTVESAKRIARTTWDRTFSKNPDFVNLALDDEEKRSFRWDGWSAVEGYFAMEDPGAVEVVGLEERVRVNLGEVPVTGIIDRIERREGMTVVSDYKTGKVPTGSYKGEALLQPHLYAAMLGERGVQVDRVRLLYITSQAEVAGPITETEIGSARQRVSDAWGAIHDDFESGHFETRPSKLCDWCGYKSFCPAWQS